MQASIAGDTAAWFAAVGTVGTPIFLVYDFVGRERQDRAERVRSAASKVAYWPELEGERTVRFVVRNAGELPVYEALVVTNDVILGAVRNLLVGTLPPGESTRLVPAEDVDNVDPDELRVTLRNKPEFLSQGLYFTDGGGRRWRRDSKGALAQQG
jgi:hypothetical protein